MIFFGDLKEQTISGNNFRNSFCIGIIRENPQKKITQADKHSDVRWTSSGSYDPPNISGYSQPLLNLMSDTSLYISRKSSIKTLKWNNYG